jgi:hypothetical protein
MVLALIAGKERWWQTAFLSCFWVFGSHSLVTYCTMECDLLEIAFCGILLLIGLGLGYLSFPQDVLPASLTVVICLTECKKEGKD